MESRNTMGFKNNGLYNDINFFEHEEPNSMQCVSECFDGDDDYTHAIKPDDMLVPLSELQPEEYTPQDLDDCILHDVTSTAIPETTTTPKVSIRVNKIKVSTHQQSCNSLAVFDLENSLPQNEVQPQNFIVQNAEPVQPMEDIEDLDTFELMNELANMPEKQANALSEMFNHFDPSEVEGTLNYLLSQMEPGDANQETSEVSQQSLVPLSPVYVPSPVPSVGSQSPQSVGEHSFYHSPNRSFVNEISHQPVESKEISHQPVESREIFHLPEGSKEIFHLPEGSKEIFHQPVESREIFHLPEESKEIFHLPEGSREIFHLPEGSKEIFHQPEESKAVSFATLLSPCDYGSSVSSPVLEDKYSVSSPPMEDISVSSPPDDDTESVSSFTVDSEEILCDSSKSEIHNYSRSPVKKSSRKCTSGSYPEGRKERKKEQNKQAALRYRQKKRQEDDKLMVQVEAQEERQKKLKAKYSNLKQELSYLKKLMREVLIAKGTVSPDAFKKK